MLEFMNNFGALLVSAAALAFNLWTYLTLRRVDRIRHEGDRS